ncbi:Retrovirus-related Pol polyprotein from transposon 17.6 [Lucilia cuprina]|nr:Retrovirus-related Pol polyprotein from transposon 17.6 [Lucilia cuprina]
MEKKKKPEETKLNCYGCGAVGFYRSNCPTCNYKTVLESPKEMDFHSIQTNIVGRNVPTVEINVSGLKGEAYLDTAARTSIAGYFLYKQLVEKKVKFQSVFAEITLADGISRKENVYSTIIIEPYSALTLLEQAGIVMDLAQRTWHYKDEPQMIFQFKSKHSKVKDEVYLNQANINDDKPSSSNVSHINNFVSWFESNNKNDSENIPTLKSIYSLQNDYSPRGILKIFEDSLPQNFEMPKEKDVDLFPPLKKKRTSSQSPLIKTFPVNAIDFNICENEKSNLNVNEKENLIKLLKSYECVFKNISTPIIGIKHKIDTGNHSPITNPPYGISPAMNVIERNYRRKGISLDNSIRLGVDYRKLNTITVTDTYPLPRMEDLLHAAKTTPYMSTIDLKSGYWQIEMNEEDKLKTAFTTPFGIYVFNRMPFGLKNAPATFQRVIDKIKSSLPSVLILAYLDDIIICSKNFDSHLSDLDLTLNKLKTIEKIYLIEILDLKIILEHSTDLLYTPSHDIYYTNNIMYLPIDEASGGYEDEEE